MLPSGKSLSDLFPKQVGYVGFEPTQLQSLDIIDEILAIADSIMVARGDLGIEVPIAQLPHIQKDLIRKAIQAAKPVVTATQMLRSMVENPRLTRAEVADVANAVLDGSDALMLSDESAVGAYPIEPVKILTASAEAAEARLFAQRPFAPLAWTDSVSAAEAVGHAASLVAHHAKATAIICCTRTGQTARLVAKYRPVQPILAFISEAQTVRPLSCGVLSHRLQKNSPQLTNDKSGNGTCFEKGAYLAGRQCSGRVRRTRRQANGFPARCYNESSFVTRLV